MSDMNLRLMAELDVDTKKAQDKITTLASGNNAPLDSNFINNDTILQNVNEKFLTLNEMINSVIGSFKVFTDKLKDFPEHGGGGGGGGGNPLPPNPGDGHNQNPFFSKQVFGKYMSNGVTALGYGSSIYEGFNAYRIRELQGDFRGAEVGGYRTAGNSMKSIGGSLLMTGNGGLMAAGGLLMIGGLISNLIASGKEVENAEDNKFLNDYAKNYNSLRLAYGDEKKVPYINYDDIYYKTEYKDNIPYVKGRDYSAIVNTYKGELLADDILSLNKGLGLKDSEFLSLVAKQREYGVTDIDQAAKNVKDIANLSLATNGNTEVFSSVLGEMNKFSKGELNTTGLYQSAMASGLAPTQFQEFLEGLSTAVERGVASGNKVVVEDIGNTIQWLGNINNNDVNWTGARGSDAYNTLSSNLKNSVDLQSPEQIMAFKALKKQYPNLSTMDILQKLESGNFNQKDITSIIDSVNSYYKDPNERIFAIQSLMGLSLKQSEDLLLNYKNKSSDKSNIEIPNSQNASTLETDIYNETSSQQNVSTYLHNNVAKIDNIIPNVGINERSKVGLTDADFEKITQDEHLNKWDTREGNINGRFLMAALAAGSKNTNEYEIYKDAIRKVTEYDDATGLRIPFEASEVEELKNVLINLTNELKSKGLVSDNTEYTFFFDANAKLNQ